jgi:hypothetical protein
MLMGRSVAVSIGSTSRGRSLPACDPTPSSAPLSPSDHGLEPRSSLSIVQPKIGALKTTFPPSSRISTIIAFIETTPLRCALMVPFSTLLPP